VPTPQAVTGHPSAAQILRAAETSSVLRGNTTASGMVTGK
jgi:hypothetical protein